MNVYLVTLADRHTGQDQRVLVQSPNSDNMQEFIESDEVLSSLELEHPVVIAIHQLRIKRPIRNTTMPSLVRG